MPIIVCLNTKQCRAWSAEGQPGVCACVVAKKMDDLNIAVTPRSPQNRGIKWSNDVTNALIELWAAETIQYTLEHSKSSKETRAVYQTLKVNVRRFYTFE